MPLYKCQECGTQRKYSPERAGKKVTCSTCGASGTLPGDDDYDDLEDDGPIESPRSRRRVKSRSKSKHKPSKIGSIVLRVLGILVALHGACLLIVWGIAILISVVFGNLILAAITTVLWLAVAMGIKGATGFGVAVSRENRVEGNAGIVAGIMLIEGVFLGMFLIFQLFVPRSDRPIVTVPDSAPMPQPVRVSDPSSTASTSLPATTTVAGNPTATATQAPPQVTNSPPMLAGDATDERRRHADPAGVSLIPPPGFQAETIPGVSEARLLGPVSNGFRPNFKIIAEISPVPLDNHVRRQMLRDRKQRPLAGAPAVDFETTDGVRGIKVVSDVTINGQALRMIDYYFEQWERKYCITVGVLAVDGPKFETAFDTCAKTVRLPAVPQIPANNTPAPSTQRKLLSLPVVGFTGNGDMTKVAQQATRFIAIIDQTTVKYDAALQTLNMEVTGNSISTRPITEALEQAGIQTKGVRLGPVSK